MEKQQECYELNEAERKAVERIEKIGDMKFDENKQEILDDEVHNGDLSEEEKKLIKSAIDKQNKEIQIKFRDEYLFHIAAFFLKHQNSEALHRFNLCLEKYDPASTIDILQVICDIYDTLWNDFDWRKEHYAFHQKKIDECNQEIVEDKKEESREESKEEGEKTSTENEKKKTSKEKDLPYLKTQISLYYQEYHQMMDKHPDSNNEHKQRYDVDDGMRERIATEISRLDREYKIINELYGIPLSAIEKYAQKDSSAKTITYERLEKLANAFHCSIMYLLGETPERSTIRIDDDGESIDFAVSFRLNNKEVEKFVKYFTKHYDENIIERLFIITSIWSEIDCNRIMQIISLIGSFVDKGRE